MIRIAAIVLMVLGSASAAFARPNTGRTVEWLTDASDAIGVYEVTAVEITSMPQADNPAKKQWGRWGTAKVTAVLRITEKGTPPKEVDAEYMLHPTDSEDDIRNEIAKGTQVVCFLRASPPENQINVYHLANLDSPPTHGPHSLFFPDFTVARNREAILKCIDSRVAAPRTGDGKNREDSDYRVEVPPDKEAFDILYGGSLCYLLVPLDLWPQAASK